MVWIINKRADSQVLSRNCWIWEKLERGINERNWEKFIWNKQLDFKDEAVFELERYPKRQLTKWAEQKIRKLGTKRINDKKVRIRRSLEGNKINVIFE